MYSTTWNIKVCHHKPISSIWYHLVLLGQWTINEEIIWYRKVVAENNLRIRTKISLSNMISLKTEANQEESKIEEIKLTFY